MMQILQAMKMDHCAELFVRAIKTGADIQSANRKLLLRMHLYVALSSLYLLLVMHILTPDCRCSRQQAELIIKAPKGHHQNRDGHSSEMMQGD